MAQPTTPKVLIVGGGPSGLILALSLLKNGIPVRVIEKTLHERIGQRGPGLLPRTLETLESLGVLDKVLAHERPTSLVRVYKRDEDVETLNVFDMQPHFEPTPACPYLNLRLLGQDKLDKILRTEMNRYGTSVDFGVELESFEQFDDRVQVKLVKHFGDTEKTQVEEVSYEYLIGADGAKSSVRKQLGLSFLGEMSEEKFVVGDVKLEGLSTETWHVFGEMTNVTTTLRPTEDEGVFCFLIGGQKFENAEEVASSEELLRDLIRKGTGYREDIVLKDFICHNHYQINTRMVDRFSVGRVFLAGDAAHIHSFTGAQGLNTGVRDAFNLGWKLALVLKRLAPSSLLDSYNAERRPVVSEMLNITSGVLKHGRTTMASDKFWRRTGSFNQLGVNYRWSSLVFDEWKEKRKEIEGRGDNPGSAYNVETGGEVQAGDRAPDAPGLVKIGVPEDTPMRVFNLFDPSRHTVLVFADTKYEPILSSLMRYPAGVVRPIVIFSAGKGCTTECDAFEDRDGHAHEAYKGPEHMSGVFVIRPDGVVGARVGRVDKLNSYFTNVFDGLMV